MRCHCIIAVVYCDLFRFEFDRPVGDLRFTEQPYELAIDTYTDRISGSIVDSSFYVTLRWWNGVSLNIQRVGNNIQAIRTVRNSIRGNPSTVFSHTQRSGRIFYRVFNLSDCGKRYRKKYYYEY